MREIKFRAWNGGMMRYLHDDEFILNKSGIFADCEMGDKGRDRDWPLMQFTGLKDKNGKEIYEGDVVRLKFNEEWELKLSVVRWDTEKWGFWLYWKDGETERPVRTQMPTEIIEIIGNIYENPELLKEG